MEQARSLPCTQQAFTGPYPKPGKYSPHLHCLFLWDTF